MLNEFLEMMNAGKPVLKKSNNFSWYVCYLRYLETGTFDFLFQVIHHQISAGQFNQTFPVIVKYSDTVTVMDQKKIP